MTDTAKPAGEPANPSASWTPDQWDGFHQLLDRLNETRGPKTNANDRGRVLITACIGEGINTAGQIINALAPLGFKRGHLGAMLSPGKGSWLRKDTNGKLSLAGD
jgi:hypothetical protein